MMENEDRNLLDVSSKPKAEKGVTLKIPKDHDPSRRKYGLAVEDGDVCEPAILAWVKSRNYKDKDKVSRNPFTLPSDTDIFKRRAAETLVEKQERAFLTRLPVQEKTTLLSRHRLRSAPLRELKEEPEHETQKSKRDKTIWKTVVSNGRTKDKESIQEYKARQQEMFRVQYATAVKKESIRKLKRDSEQALHKIKQEEVDLEKDAGAFEQFVKLNDQSSVEAIKLAEKETLAKLELITKIKRVTSEIMIVKSDISRYQEILSESHTYKRFLTAVAPPAWREEQMRKREERRRRKLIQQLPCVKAEPRPSIAQTRRKSKMWRTAATKLTTTIKRPPTQEKKCALPEIVEEPIDLYEFDSEEEPEIYFKDPQEMQNILADLEEQNLSCIQNFQATEEALEEIHCQQLLTQKKMDNQTDVLKEQIEILQAAIERAKDRVQEFQLKSKMFSFGEFSADKQDAMLSQLHKKVKEVYTTCVGDVDCKISTVQMLSSIENRMLEIQDALELQSPEKIKMLKAAREKEGRIRQRDEKLRLKQQHQEERLKVALERATRAAKKQAGRKLMARSEPPTIKKNDQTHSMSTKEQEDFLYFFT